MEWFSILTSPATVWTLAGSLVVMALWTSVSWNRIVNNAIKTIRRASESFQKVEGQTTFIAKYHELVEEVKGSLIKNRAWALAWARFELTLLPLERGDGQQVIAANRPPADFFNLAALHRQHRMFWLRGLPNYLVGFGLSLTFLGIILVIARASDSLRATADAAQQTTALRELLSAAALKFSTSLAGVASSIYYSIFYRSRNARIERELDDYCAVVSRRIAVLNSGVLLNFMLSDSRRQTACLESLADNIAVGVGTKLSEATAVLGQALTRLEQHLQTVGEQMGQKTDNVAAAIGGLSERIVQTTSADMERLVGSATAGLDAALKGHIQDIGSQLEKVSERIEEAHRNFGGVAAQVGELRDEYVKLSDDIFTRGGEISKLFLDTQEGIEAALEKAQTAAGGIRDSFLQISAQVEGVKELPGAFSTVTEAVGNAAQLWRDVGNQLGQTSLANAESITQIRDAVAGLQDNWQQQSTRIAEIDTHLAATITDVQKYLDNYATRMGEFTTALDSNLAKAVGTFGATIRGLDEAPERIGAAADVLKSAAHEAARAMEPVSVAADGLRSAAKDVTQALEPFREIGRLATSLTDSAKALTEAVARIAALPQPGHSIAQETQQ